MAEPEGFTAAKLSDFVTEQVHAFIKAEGSLGPTALVVVEGNVLPIPIPQLTDELDRRRVRGLFEVAALGGADFVVFISETWHVVFKSPEERDAWRGRSFAEHPERREAVMIDVAGRQGERVMRLLDMYREGGRLVLVERTDEPMTITSRFLDHLRWA